MSENPTPQTQPESKEIDLIDATGRVFSGIGRGIRNLFVWIGKMFSQFFRFTKTYFWILFALAILGGSGGFLRVHLQEDFFATEMMVETQLVPRAQIADRINSLDLLIQDNNAPALASMLNISTEKAENFLSIRADIVQVRVDISRRGADMEAEEVGPQFIRIRIRTLNNEDIKYMEGALVSFIENDPFVQERLAIFRTNNLAMQQAVQTEIDMLREFQRINLERAPQVMFPGTVPLMVQQEERTYVAEILELQGLLLSLQEVLKLTRPLIVTQPFFPFETPANRTLFNIIVFALFAVVAGYIGLLIRKNWKYLMAL